tara:strand:- start:1529 stop:1978 length:450 start_codon:yes stop_codon:yes gene_type:complete
MPFIGKAPVTTFEATTAVQRFNGDNSDTTFTLNRTVSSVQDVLVSVDGVVQDTSAYTIPDGTTLTFTAAPSSGTNNIFVNFLAPQTGTVTPADENKGNFKGGGLFRTNAQSLTSNITILATENAQVTGPLTVASGVTLTVESGGRLVTS